MFFEPDNFTVAFDQFDQLLGRHQALWRESPFLLDTLSWQADFPELHQALLDLTDTHLNELNDEALLIRWVARFVPELAEVAAWQIKADNAEQIAMAKFADVGIPGRKKSQIVGFASALKGFARSDCGAVVDWCSGKGFLARQIHQVMASPVTCMEYNGALCQSGSDYCQKHDLDVNFVEQDVLGEIAPELLANADIHTALHACGDLHRRMLQTAVVSQVSTIACSPCCYHLTGQEHYQAFSRQGQGSLLQLDKKDLMLAVLHTVTAGDRVKRLRQVELLWRVAFDLLRREVTGCDHYQTMPSVNKQWFSGDFADFCHHLAELRSVALPSSFDSEHYLALARDKLARIFRLEKARGAFRRAMEYWLLLDRALYLQEQGYQVALKTFCDVSVTPRNAILMAGRCGH